MNLRIVMPAVVSLMLVACGGTPPDSAPQGLTEGESELVIGGGQCGKNICGEGTYCCNESCGTCAPLGSECTQQVCNDPTAQPEEEDTGSRLEGTSCGGSVCGAGTYCCNESCGICAPTGGSCTQQMCN